MMLAQACRKRGIRVGALANLSELPIRSTMARIYDAKDPVSREDFWSSHQVFLAESEFFDWNSIPNPHRNQVLPSVKALETLSHRDQQKKCIEDLGIPTAPFQTELKRALDEMGLPLVAKIKRGGFDGRGTFILKTAEDLEAFSQSHSIEDFLFEKHIEFQRELAIVAGRDRSGQTHFFDLVETTQIHAQLNHLVGPIASGHLTSIQNHIERLMDGLDYCGVLGVELFDCGEFWLVNELAPRVHNSGHYTMWTHDRSQFDLHVEIATTKSIRSPKRLSLHPAYCLYNLISEKGLRWDPQKIAQSSNVVWYHKEEPGLPSQSSFRKVGHLLEFGLDTEEAKQKALRTLESLVLTRGANQ